MSRLETGAEIGAHVAGHAVGASAFVDGFNSVRTADSRKRLIPVASGLGLVAGAEQWAAPNFYRDIMESPDANNSKELTLKEAAFIAAGGVLDIFSFIGAAGVGAFTGQLDAAIAAKTAYNAVIAAAPGALRATSPRLAGFRSR